MERDALLRNACFLALDALRARLGDELPLRAGLEHGFNFDGRRIPFLNRQKGIYRAAAQSGPAALSLLTSHSSPYEADEPADDGFWYAYRAGDPGSADNRALREAHALAVPVVYFVAARPGWYRAEYPCFVVADDPAGRRVKVSIGMLSDGDAVLPGEVERRFAVREVRLRLHQARFRGLVLPAYRERCAICTLHEPRLLDAAHIVPDAQQGAAAVTNGLSLCTIHHRAYDQDLVGVDPDYRVHVAPRLLEDEDGPMLELLKGFDGSRIVLPGPRKRPSRERLAERFARFAAG